MGLSASPSPGDSVASSDGEHLLTPPTTCFQASGPGEGEQRFQQHSPGPRGHSSEEKECIHKVNYGDSSYLLRKN